MNQDNQQFEQIKKLLKLKQHEVPPPGYFDKFSGQVISRIRVEQAERSRSVKDRLQAEGGWLRRFLQIFEARPGVVGGFATSLCLLLLLTVVFAERSDSDLSSNNLMTISTPAASSQGAVNLATASNPSLASLQPAQPTGGIMISTNPEINLQSNPSLFGQPGSASLFQTASFVPGGQQ